MMSQHLLTGYADVKVISEVVVQMAQRLSRPNRLAEGGAEIHRIYEELEQDFLAFFPKLLAFVRERPMKSQQTELPRGSS